MKPINKIIDQRIEMSKTDAIGVIDSDFSQRSDQNSGDTWTWACDVKLQGEDTVLKGVPIATNNRDVLYAEFGKAVELRQTNGKWSIVGLSKTVFGDTHISKYTFTEDVAVYISEDWSGHTTRKLTYGEIGEITVTGYGFLPYGIMGRFTRAGIFIEFVGY
jgi:hypothetical protein